MANPHNLIRRAQKLERRFAFNSLSKEITKRPLSSSEQQRFLAIIMAKTASGAITPQEARKLTKAIGGDSDRNKEG